VPYVLSPFHEKIHHQPIEIFIIKKYYFILKLTLSKKTSTPLGAAVFKASLSEIFL